ncbi:MAG TPA: lysylphosphatidylglycerol synthase domain-containing protein [Kofleriaceae bacterium]|nr:lysylphosphatidylglycerol synthase domain-containing protein [Kofleriaceae bacterium]
MSRLRFGAMLAGFVALTALGVWWAAPPRDELARTWAELRSLGIANVLGLVALGLAAIGAEMLRLVVFGRVLGVRVSWRAAFDASVANDLFSWISPGGLAGEPASVYVMSRRGVPVDAALAITFGKFATSFALIMGAACVLLALGHGPAIPTWAIASIVATIGFGVVLVGGFVVGAWFPARSLRTIDRWLATPRGPLVTRALTGLRSSIARLAQFRAGPAGWLAMTATHVLYYGAYIGLVVALGAMFDARSIAGLVPIAIVYQAFTYIAPAPGIPEAGAAAFFGGLVPDGGAFVVVLLFRALTAYLQIVLGLVYLPVGGMLRAIVSRSDRA